MNNARLIEAAHRAMPEDSYDPIYYPRLFAIEDRHFWFRSRNQVIATLVGQITASLAPGYRVLEVGCGTGNVLRVLEKVCLKGTVVGMDLFSEGLQFAQRRTSCSLVQGDVHRPPFETTFDVVMLFDVLEHLSDDVQVLCDLHSMLPKGGALLLTVPAHPSLWSYFDEASHHYRRYQLSDLESKLVRTGYRVEYLTQYMAILYPLVWLGRRIRALTKRRPNKSAESTLELTSAELSITPVINEMLGWLLSQESHLLAGRRSIPIGTSLVAIARKN